VLGHEIRKRSTDPGAESSTGLVPNGAWFDTKAGDRRTMRVVGDGLQSLGAAFILMANDGRAYPVHDVWSKESKRSRLLLNAGILKRVFRDNPVRSNSWTGV